MTDASPAIRCALLRRALGAAVEPLHQVELLAVFRRAAPLLPELLDPAGALGRHRPVGLLDGCEKALLFGELQPGPDARDARIEQGLGIAAAGLALRLGLRIG